MQRVNYRRIWESHFGPIPVDDSGRPYEIHHVDGNRNNNDISNLVCVSIDEHYKIHNEQGDWGSAGAVLRRINNPQDHNTLSHLSKKSNQERVERGTHNFLKANRSGPSGNEFNSEMAHECAQRRVAAGTHNFIGVDNKNQQQVAYDRLLNNTMIEFLNGKNKIAVGIQFGRAKKHAIANNLTWKSDWDLLKDALQNQAKKSR